MISHLLIKMYICILHYHVMIFVPNRNHKINHTTMVYSMSLKGRVSVSLKGNYLLSRKD